MVEGGASSGPEIPSGPKISRRTFLKGAAVAGAVGVAIGVAGGKIADAMVDRRRIESGWQSQIVEVNGAKVELSWVESKPKGKENVDPTRAVINISPWSWAAEMPIIRNGGQKIADRFGENTYTISTRTDKIHPEALFTESQGIAQFITERNFREVTIFGHSEGGIKAVDLAAILQANNPQVKINGVVLLDPMGMYSRDIADLAGSFFNDTRKVGPEEFKRAQKLPPEGMVLQFLLSLWQDLRFFGLQYPKAVQEELKAMARPNPRLSQIKAPVLLLTGERDYISDFRRYFSKDEVEKRLKSVLSDEQLRSWIDSESKWEKLPQEERDKFGSKEEFVKHYMQAYRKHEELVRMSKARNQYLRENILPQAENASFILATKPAASHGGLPDTRFESVIRVAKRIFPRFRRQSPSTI